MAEQKINPYNLAELKNTTDDALGNYVRSLSFKQDHSKTDFRLVVGWVAVVIAGATFAADYKLGWEATKYWTAAAVLSYSILNSIFTYWLWFVEKGLIFEGSRNGKHISIRSKVNKHEPAYFLDVSVKSSDSTTPSTWHIRAPFTTWFTADGYFVAQPFQQWLASSIEAIGDADQKNAMRDQRDDLAAPIRTVQSSTSADVAEKATKRKKKS